MEQAYDQSGWQGYFEEEVRLLEQWDREGRGFPNFLPELARSYLELGDVYGVLNTIDRAHRDGDRLVSVLGFPRYDPMRSDPRFQELLRRFNYPQSAY